MGRTAESKSFSFPPDGVDEFVSYAKSLGFKNHSEYLRALHEAAKHYELRPHLHPTTGDRILRSVADIKSEAARGRPVSEADK